MPTPSPYGPYRDLRGVRKTAKKMRDDFQCDTFVTRTADWKYKAWAADFPGDKMLAGYTVVETFLYVPPLPPAPHPYEYLLDLLERLDYEVNHNPAPAGECGLASIIREALDCGLIETVRTLK